MKKSLLIGFATLVVYSTILFSNSFAGVNSLPLQENKLAIKSSAFAVALQSNEIVLPPVEEEGSMFTNPFFIVRVVFILMLAVWIVLYKRKRDEKRNKEQEKAKYSSSSDTHDFGKKSKAKRYSKEEMSQILKASASKGKSQVVNSTQSTQEENQSVSVQNTKEHHQSTPEPLVFELKVPEPVEPLPQVVDEETYYDALVDCEDEEAMIRIVAARVLSKYKTVNSVKLLSHAAMDDVDEEVRLEAVEGLKAIGHPSVFAPLLVAVSDDNPNVKQVAIKAFSSLSFNMTDNYVRLIQSGDEGLLKKVAKACLVTGLVHKAFVQITGQDQEQANEGYALLSLLAKAGETKPLLDAITKHPSTDIRVLAIKIMNETHKPEVQEQLMDISERQDLPSVVRASLLQTVRRNASLI